MDDQPIACVPVSVDTPLARGPALFWGLIFYTAAAGTNVRLRDGVNVSAPVKFGPYGENLGMAPIVLTRPILFRQGIFVDFSGAGDTATVLFELVREEQLTPLPETPASVETE